MFMVVRVQIDRVIAAIRNSGNYRRLELAASVIQHIVFSMWGLMPLSLLSALSRYSFYHVGGMDGL